MTAGLDQLDRLLNLPLESFIEQAAKQHEDEITDLNRLQLDRGLDSEGRSLGTYKVFAYKNRFEPVDLRDTDAFRNSIQIDPVTGGFLLEATDSKTDELQDKYGDQILGIADNDLRTVGEIILDDVIDKIRQDI